MTFESQWIHFVNSANASEASAADKLIASIASGQLIVALQRARLFLDPLEEPGYAISDSKHMGRVQSLVAS